MPKLIFQYLISSLLLFSFSLPLVAQTPFVCKGQIYAILENSNELVELSLNPINNAININAINPTLGLEINALGYRSSDNLLYGIEPTTFNLYQIDALGNVVDLGILNLQSGLEYNSGAISTNGRFFYTIGSTNGKDQVLAAIDLDSPGFPVQIENLNGSSQIVTMAVDPYSNALYGYDFENRSIVTVPTNGGTPNALPPLIPGNELQGLFFDPFGNLSAYGSAIGGVVNGYFSVDKTDGSVSVLSTGSIIEFAAAASCPYGVAINAQINPVVSFPCEELIFTYTLANGSNGPQTGIDLSHALPAGFSFLNVVDNPFGGTINPAPPAAAVNIENMVLPRGVDSLVVTLEVDDIMSGLYRSQALLADLPASLGSQCLSDDPTTLNSGDSTKIRINRFDGDSLRFNFFICTGETIRLDASSYGSELLWNNGSRSAQLTVGSPGIYSVEAISGCQSVFVYYDVTQADCPYTIDIAHKIIPQETLPCTEVVFEFIIGNDSGFPRSGLNFFDQLPAGFNIIEILDNPFGGALQGTLPTSTISIEDFTLLEGNNTLRVLVEIGDVPRGTYKNQARLSGLPVVLGDMRTSFDPDGGANDSTAVNVLDEIAENSVYLDYFLCGEEVLTLDGSIYGESYLWSDGSEGSSLDVSEAGEYELTILDGCINSYVYFTVTLGEDIEVILPAEEIVIRRGDDSLISPRIINAADTLILLQWNDPFLYSLSCHDCLEPTANPVQNVTYEIVVSNGMCRDSASVRFIVEDKRKLYFSNIFSPNGDGFNDYFYLQSPDFGIVLSLRIYNRWGAQVFGSTNTMIDTELEGWDGTINQKQASSGNYVWIAEIEFEDGERGTYSGSVSLIY